MLEIAIHVAIYLPSFLAVWGLYLILRSWQKSTEKAKLEKRRWANYEAQREIVSRTIMGQNSSLDYVKLVRLMEEADTHGWHKAA